MRPTSREEQLRILDAAAGTAPDDKPQAWDAVRALLEVPAKFIPGLQIALAEGRYRQANVPGAYVLAVAKTAGRKLWREGTRAETRVGPLAVPSNFLPTKSDAARHDDFIDHQHQRLDYLFYERDWLIDCISEEYRRLDGSVDWHKLGQDAGLSTEQIDILIYRSVGYTRQQIADIFKMLYEDGDTHLWRDWKAVERAKPTMRALLSGQDDIEREVAANVLRERTRERGTPVQPPLGVFVPESTSSTTLHRRRRRTSCA